ncbi:MAG: hypothetical protein SFV23_26105 [Planctomycetaceae bacterium]|nr:hypothetical protein [Planctomycetaceae bacterium]
MNERELLVDCLKRLNAVGIPYMLTGSMACNMWGIPRSTHDLDVVVQLEPSHVAQLVRAFENDYFIQESSVRSALQPPYQFNALDNHSAMKIDFWVLKSGEYERTSFARRMRFLIFNEKAWVSTAEDVILSKLRWNKIAASERQLQDVAGVWALQERTLDLSYLYHWADQLEVRENLERIMRGDISLKTT